MAHACICRNELSDVVKDIGRCFEVPVVSETFCKFDKYSPVFPCFSRCFSCLAKQLDGAGRIGAGSRLFRPACGREYYVGFLRCLRQENILYDKEVERVKGVGNVVRIRVSYHWVFTHDVECLEFALSRCFHHGCNRESYLALLRHFASPESFDLFRCCGQTDLQIAG